MLLRGEWFLDSTEGMPWQGEVLGKQPRASYDWAIRQRMLGTPGVTGISDYASRLDPQSRGLSVTATHNPLWLGHRAGGSMTILSTAPVIDAAGIRAPSYGEVLQYFRTSTATSTARTPTWRPTARTASCWPCSRWRSTTPTPRPSRSNAFSPATASGEALSSNVKINGLARAWPRARRSICASWGRAAPHRRRRGAGRRSRAVELPASVTIPPAGEITVTALCRQVGAVAAAPGSITRIGTPTLGWQSVTNPAAATPGAPSKATRRCGSGKPCRWRCRRAPCWKARSAWRPCRACCATSPTRTTRPSRTPMACRRTASRWWWTAATQG